MISEDPRVGVQAIRCFKAKSVGRVSDVQERYSAVQLSVRHAAKDCLVAHPNNANKPEMRERETGP